MYSFALRSEYGPYSIEYSRGSTELQVLSKLGIPNTRRALHVYRHFASPLSRVGVAAGGDTRCMEVQGWKTPRPVGVSRGVRKRGDVWLLGACYWSPCSLTPLPNPARLLPPNPPRSSIPIGRVFTTWASIMPSSPEGPNTVTCIPTSRSSIVPCLV